MEQRLTQTEAAKRLNRTVRCLQQWRKANYGPKGVKLGNRWEFREADIERFIAENTFDPERQAA